MNAPYRYDGLARRAAALLKRYGQAAVIERDVTTPDPLKPWQSTATTETAALVAVIEDYGTRDRAFAFGDGTTVLDGDKRATCSVGDLTWDPAPPQRLIVDGDVYSIVRLERRLAPGGHVIAYVLQVRGGPS